MPQRADKNTMKAQTVLKPASRPLKRKPSAYQCHAPRYLFINMYLAGEVRKLDLAAAEVVATATLASPDNLTWSQDGTLLVASHTDGLLEFTACQAFAGDRIARVKLD